MPLPSPRRDEDKGAFIDRCMGDDTAVEDFFDTSQRRAVCEDRWERRNDNEGQSMFGRLIRNARGSKQQTRSQLPRIAERVFNQPHAITPHKMHAILWVLRDRLGAEINIPQPEASALDESGDYSDSYVVKHGVALVPVHGTLVQKGDALDAQSGLLGYDRLVSLIEAAHADPEVGAILLDIDSGGGETAGMLDAADRINAIAQRTPMAALVNEHACSAAYLVAASAGRVWVTQGASVGSIGVIMAHVDQTQANAQRGIEVTELFAGAYKADGSPYHELGSEEQQRLQGFVDQVFGQLVAKVATMRGIDEQRIRDTQSGVFLGQQSFDRGLADAQHTLESAVAQLRSEKAQSPQDVSLTTAKSVLGVCEVPRSDQGDKAMTQRANGGTCKLQAGENLANTLENLIEQQTSDERSSQDVQDDMADAAGIDPSTVDGILNGEINCPPLERLDGFAEVLDTSVDNLRQAAEQDGCDYSNSGESARNQASPATARRKGTRTMSASNAADPATIVEQCNQAGFPSLASSLIREQATEKRLNDRLEAMKTIQTRCKDAVDGDWISQEQANQIVSQAMADELDPDKASTMIFTKAQNRSEAAGHVQSQFSPDAKGDGTDSLERFVAEDIKERRTAAEKRGQTLVTLAELEA